MCMNSPASHLSMSTLPLALAHALVKGIIEDTSEIAELADAVYPHGNNAETKGTMRRQKVLDRLVDIGNDFGLPTCRFRFDGWMPRFDDKNSNIRFLDLGSVALTIASVTDRRPLGRRPKYRPHVIEPVSVQHPLFEQVGPPPAPYQWSRLLVVAYEVDRSDPTLARVGRIRLRAAACDGTDSYIDLGDMRAYAALHDAAPTAEVPAPSIPLEAKVPLGAADPIQPEVHEGDRLTQGTADAAGEGGEPSS